MSGVRSSRRIEAACRTDAAFRVIAGGVVPDHATVARFVVDHEQAIEDSFFEVLALCATAGLVSVGTIAIDGTKMAADASLEANRSRACIEKELESLRATAKLVVAEARATDAAEETQAGLFASDRLPVELSTPSGRQARLEAALALIEAEEAARQAQATERAAQAHQASAEGRKLAGRKPTDPREAFERAEADAQAAVNDNQVVVAPMLSQEANDIGLYQRMVSATQDALSKLGVGTTGGPPPEEATALEAMEHRLRTPEGSEAYSHRSHIVEPVFGDSKENRGFTRFRRRGLAAARSEWSLINTVHNLAKLYNAIVSSEPEEVPALA